MEQELRDEFQRINEKLDTLAPVKGNVEALQTSFVNHVNDDRIFLQGINGKPGLVLQVDRLERSMAVYQRFFWGMASAVTVCIVETAWRIIAK